MADDDSGEYILRSKQLKRMSSTVYANYKRALGTKLVDPNRLAAIYGSALFQHKLDDQLDALAYTAAKMLHTPRAEINLITDHEQVTVGSYGVTHSRKPVQDSYCQHTIMGEGPIVIDNAPEHSLVCDSVYAHEGGAVSYLGVPLVDQQGFILGSLCVWDPQETRDWDKKDVERLVQVALLVTAINSSET